MIVGLLPEVLGDGGIQQACRNTAGVLAGYAERKGMRYHLLSLNDQRGSQRLRVGQQEFEIQGFGRRKKEFVSCGVRLALAGARSTVAAHPYMAQVAWAMKTVAPHLRILSMTHGIEVWNPLPTLRRLALAGSEVVLAPSQYTAERLAGAQGVARDRIRCLPWGLEPERSVKLAAPIHSAMSSEGRIILTVGRLAANERYKGVDTLIQALAQLKREIPDVQLIVVGEGDDRARLEGLARAMGISDRVSFLGRLSTEELITCYRRADVFAMPSRGEGFGFVFLEAMACGKPVIGGAHGGTCDIIEDGVNGFLVPYSDTDKLAHVLCRLLTDDSLRSEMGERARETVCREYLFERFQNRLEQLLEPLCAS